MPKRYRDEGPKTLSRQDIMRNANEIVKALHDEGFSMLLIHSMYVGGDDNFWQKVMIDEEEISSERMEKIMQIAQDVGATLHLTSIRINGPSYITLWPKHVED